MRIRQNGLARRMGGFLLAASLAYMASPSASAQTGLVFVSNERSNNIVVLNGSDQVVGTFKTCARPRGMRFTPDRRQLIVGCGSDDTIALYDVASQKLMKRYRDIADPETFDL